MFREQQRLGISRAAYEITYSVANPVRADRVPVFVDDTRRDDVVMDTQFERSLGTTECRREPLFQISTISFGAAVLRFHQHLSPSADGRCVWLVKSTCGGVNTSYTMEVGDVADPIDEILHNEGGFVNHPNDKGGPTNFGITKAVYEQWLGRSCTIDEVRSMKVEEAREIYERRYLVGPRIDTLPEPLRTQVLDIAVNSGPPTAIKMLQRVINKARLGPVDVDGVLGPQTRQKVIEAYELLGPVLDNALVDERKAFYRAIIDKNPSQAVFERGWMNRAERFRIKDA